MYRAVPEPGGRGAWLIACPPGVPDFPIVFWNGEMAKDMAEALNHAARLRHAKRVAEEGENLIGGSA